MCKQANSPEALMDLPFDALPASVRRRVFGVEYARLDLPGAGELYVTPDGWPVARSLLPDGWYVDAQYARHGRRLAGGSGFVYYVDVPHPVLRSVAIVVKFCRFAQEVPLSVSTEILAEMPRAAFDAARFNGPFEEFGMLQTLRRKVQQTPGVRVATKRGLAIYVPPTRYPLWRSGRSRATFRRQASAQARDQAEVVAQQQVLLDIERDYILLFGWVDGLDALDMHELGLLSEAEMRGLTRRAVRELQAAGFEMLDIKPRHLILRRRRRDGTLLRCGGELVYALIDFELLQPCTQQRGLSADCAD